MVMEHEYQKLANFRDMGGMRGAHGKAVKKNRLLRSGELSKVTEEDILSVPRPDKRCMNFCCCY